MIKYIKSASIISFITLCFCSCTNNATDPISVEKPILILEDTNDKNFVSFKAVVTDPEATCEWIFSNDQSRVKGRNVVHYFEKKGTYDVKLEVTSKKGKSEATQRVQIENDAFYYNQNETLWWSDEFSSFQLDMNNWNYDQGIGQWGNNEWQNYTSSSENSFIRDGKLIIRAEKIGKGQKEGDYTSARLTTARKKEFVYGRVEVRAKLAGGVGLWPAIWLFGRNADPYYSELDLMEYVGYDKNIIYGAVHTSHSLTNPDKISDSKVIEGVESEFHTYGMMWTEDKIEYYIDTPDNIYLSYKPESIENPEKWPFNKKLYIILNIAVGGDWGGLHGVDDSIFPKEMEIDYVRVFKTNDLKQRQ